MGISKMQLRRLSACDQCSVPFQSPCDLPLDSLLSNNPCFRSCLLSLFQCAATLQVFRDAGPPLQSGSGPVGRLMVLEEDQSRRSCRLTGSSCFYLFTLLYLPPRFEDLTASQLLEGPRLFNIRTPGRYKTSPSLRRNPLSEGEDGGKISVGTYFSCLNSHSGTCSRRRTMPRMPWRYCTFSWGTVFPGRAWSSR